MQLFIIFWLALSVAFPVVENRTSMPFYLVGYKEGNSPYNRTSAQLVPISYNLLVYDQDNGITLDGPDTPVPNNITGTVMADLSVKLSTFNGYLGFNDKKYLTVVENPVTKFTIFRDYLTFNNLSDWLACKTKNGTKVIHGELPCWECLLVVKIKLRTLGYNLSGGSIPDFPPLL